MLEELVKLIICTISSRKPAIRIGDTEYPVSYVRKRLLGLDSGHMEYVRNSLRGNTTKVYNIRAYLLTTLFNAPTTIESYRAAEVQHDLYGKQGA